MKNIVSKYAVLLLLIAFVYQPVTAQVLPFTAKKSFITIGYGFPYLYNQNFKTLETYIEAQGGRFSQSSLGPISLNYEYAIGSYLGLGLDASYAEAEYSAEFANDDIASYTTQRLGLGMRLAWHPYKRKAWDPYIAGILGYNVEVGEEYVNPEKVQRFDIPAPPDFLYGAKLGIRYFYPESAVGFFAEVGYVNTHLAQVGIAFRFGPDRETSINVWDRRR